MFSEAKTVLSNFARKIPETILGPERVSFIIENIDEIPNEHKLIILKSANHILSMMLEKEASDIELGGHGTEGYVWLRTHGKKERVKEIPQLTADEAGTLIVCLLNKNQCRHLLASRNLDFSYSFWYDKAKKNVRFRADAYFDLDTLALNMRAISASVRPMESLEFHQNAMKMMSHNYVKFGLSLITGITGSGKSSTLDSIIHHHNKFDPAHIVIIAAPVEFVHKSNAAIVRHREVGRDVMSFKEGVIQALRQDPDIIVIGEMRDPETILAALEVTDTGHKVFSTLHTSSAVESIDRIIAEVNPYEQERVRNRLADVLISVVSQKLVPTIDGRRALAKEVLIVTPSVKAAIKNDNTSEIYMMINQGAPQGMITMEQDLLRLVRHKKITADTGLAYANNKTRFMQIMKAL
ncbi:MAG: Flp pilus assembly complex ATPase component TadA [Melioribacteraceae bacterium]|nr:Flp pilus assembly complex ATPase component TadA [Melioribacteraceae bacterium]MCF8356102.1 Flp pilus assembly complex ATPase component TadA [Melioribacteraceae bacterium]MCF8395586.1 Flp pilus assembly complex ATPase component TadA [Melioribacteraceae bacterium]MCF8419688.1 Flp pilus assembly complex ATPase component TadA [Melioribacteraceae bacterium]